MHVVYRQTCRVCGSEHLVPVIDLGYQYLQGSFVKTGHVMPPKRKIPTRLVRCDVTRNQNGCGLLQLEHTLPAEILYANYWYRSGTNQTMRDHLGGIVETVMARGRFDNQRVLDIGCNDGTLLGCYPDHFEKFGVDPSDIAKEIPAPVQVVSSTFPSPMARRVIGDRKFDVVTSIAMYYDLEDPTGFAREIRDMLAEGGIWVVEMSYMPLMLKQNAFDTICHEHLEYYSLAVLEKIAAAADLRIFRCELNEINGGSIRCYLTHAANGSLDTQEDKDFVRFLRIREFELELDTDAPYKAFQKRIEGIRDELGELMKKARDAGEEVHVYGASTKGNVLLQWCGLDKNSVRCAADRNPDKHGAHTLGTEIPIVSEEESRAMKPDYYLVLPWHFKREFLLRERDTIMNGTKMIFPLPEVTVVDADNFDEAVRSADQVNWSDF